MRCPTLIIDADIKIKTGMYINSTLIFILLRPAIGIVFDEVNDESAIYIIGRTHIKPINRQNYKLVWQ